MPVRSKRSRKPANTNVASQNINEAILEQVKRLYIGKKEKGGGIEAISKSLGGEILHPRNKVTVMIIGNHSAGKSSFINWYVDENVRDTGVAIESKGFTVVTYGKRQSAPIKGEGSLRYFPHIAGIKKYAGVMEHFTTYSSVSNVKSFPMVDFLDTPGLVGGGIGYSFDVNNVIEYLADHVDLIFVFLDPIGQALCTRTMQVIEALNVKHYMKMRYYLTKADTIDNIQDLLKVTAQVTQNLAHRVNNNHGFEVPSIFLPNASKAGEEMAKMNNIGKLCAVIDKTIKQKVQVNLDRLRSDTTDLLTKVGQEIKRERFMAKDSRTKNIKGMMFGACGWVFVPLLACLLTLSSVKPHLPEDVQEHDVIGYLERPASFLFAVFPDAEFIHFVGGLVALFSVMLLLQAIYRCRARRHVMRDTEGVAELHRFKAYLADALVSREELHSKLVAQHVRED